MESKIICIIACSFYFIYCVSCDSSNLLGLFVSGSTFFSLDGVPFIVSDKWKPPKKVRCLFNALYWGFLTREFWIFREVRFKIEQKWWWWLISIGYCEKCITGYSWYFRQKFYMVNTVDQNSCQKYRSMVLFFRLHFH